MLTPNGIRAIYFDLDGTLRFNRPSGREFFMDHAATLGVPVTPQTRANVWRWEHYYWAGSPEIKEDDALYPEKVDFYYNYSRRQLIAMGCPAKQAEELGPEISRYMNEHYKPENWVHPATPGLLAELQDAGYTLGVLSNRDKPFDEELETLGIRHYFHHTVYASEANSWKPDPAVFHFAMQKANLEAKQTMYVGDNYFADIVGAQKAGLKPVLLDIGSIFENPGCPVIKSLHELKEILQKDQFWH